MKPGTISANDKDKNKRMALFVDSLVLLTWLTSTFGIIWLNFYNADMKSSFFNKGNWLLFAIYYLILIVFSRVYKGLKVGSHKTGDIIVSQIIATFCTNFITYFQISLIARKLLSVWPMFMIMGLQAVFIIIWAFVSTAIFHALYPAKNLIMIYGNRNAADSLIRKMCAREDKYRITKAMSVDEDLEAISSQLKNYDGVVICDTPNDIRNDILKYCFKNSIRTYLVPKISDIIVRGAENMELFDTPLMIARNYGLTTSQRFIKRASDIFMASIGLIIAAPFMLITALAIKICDGGPVFYKQERYTRDKKTFNLLKFRSMIVDAEKDGVARLASESDSRITPVGKIIRKIRFDELPQLLNIFKGDMSVVGPRPERPELCRQYEKEMPEFEFRLKVKAGLTGNAQVIGKYNTTPYDKLKLDLMYIEKYSFAFDIILILKTIKIIFTPASTEGVKEGCKTPIDKKEEKKGSNK